MVHINAIFSQKNRNDIVYEKLVLKLFQIYDGKHEIGNETSNVLCQLILQDLNNRFVRSEIIMERKKVSLSPGWTVVVGWDTCKLKDSFGKVSPPLCR